MKELLSLLWPSGLFDVMRGGEGRLSSGRSSHFSSRSGLVKVCLLRPGVVAGVELELEVAPDQYREVVRGIKTRNTRI